MATYGITISGTTYTVTMAPLAYTVTMSQVGPQGAAGTIETNNGGTINGDLNITDKIVHVGDTNTAIRFPTNDTVTVETAGAEALRIDSSGRVGIGTSSPASALDVVGTVTADGLTVDGTLGISDAINYNGASVFYIRSRLNGGTVQIGTETPAGTLYSPITIVGSSDYTSFSTSTSEAMRITASGNVGIGTSSPASTLDVNGDVTITDKIIHSGDTNTAIRFPAADTFTVETAGAERLRINSSGNVGIGTSSPETSLDVDGVVTVRNDLTFKYSGYTNWSVDNSLGSFRIFVPGYTAYQISAGGTHVWKSTTSSTEYMRINSAGHVGIGTSNPAASLDVNGDVTITDKIIHSGDTNTAIRFPSNDTVTVETAGVERLRVTSAGNVGVAGNVGIGTSSPQRLMHLASSGSVEFLMQSTAAAADEGRYRLRVNQTGLFLETANDVISAAQTAYEINRGTGIAVESQVWKTGGSERLRINSAGNVGINESAPDYKLDVNGTFGFTPGTSVTPVDNGDVVFELTNNTTLTIKAKGSDGVVRSGTVILV